MQKLAKFGAVFAVVMSASPAFANLVPSLTVPEPGALPMVGLALGVVALVMRRKK